MTTREPRNLDEQPTVIAVPGHAPAAEVLSPSVGPATAPADPIKDPHANATNTQVGDQPRATSVVRDPGADDRSSGSMAAATPLTSQTSGHVEAMGATSVLTPQTPESYMVTEVSRPVARVVQMSAPRTGASASPSFARTAGSAAGRSELPEVGEVVKERFELVEELGRGGMGAVFRARDLRKVEALDPDPYVAIKFISGALIGFERAFVALQREAKNAQRLNHPNIVKVFDFDRDGALVFLTMEVVHGEALHKRLREISTSPLTAAQRRHIAHGMLAGMSYAHERDVSHADLKPSNMMLDTEGNLKILDFGIARRAEYDTVFDADDLFALTIDYASPEMFAQQRPTPCDDVYALGCILYALHTGSHPFDHMRADQARNERRRATRPASASRVQWRSLRKALAFTRAQRFQNAAQFQRAYEGRDWRKLGSIAAGLLALAMGIAWITAEPLRSWATVSGLSAGQKLVLDRSLSDGAEYLAGGYPEDALYAYAEALTLDAHNPEARQAARRAMAALHLKMPPAQYRNYLSLQQQDAKTPAWLRAQVEAELARLQGP